jgi:hypothetical protein
MKLSRRLTGVVFALCMAIAGLSTASASVLVSNQGSTFFSMSDFFGTFTDFQPIAEVTVTGLPVNIGGFGVYGRAEAAGEIKFVMFDGLSLVYQSDAQSVNQGGARWFDSPTISGTLTAGHTYSMGLVASNLFAWGRNSEPVSPISGGGLTINGFESISQPTFSTSGGFAGDPILIPEYGVDYFQASVRVMSAGGGVPPIPEPSEWAMLLAGLMVVAFVAKRQRRTSI